MEHEAAASASHASHLEAVGEQEEDQEEALCSEGQAIAFPARSRPLCGFCIKQVLALAKAGTKDPGGILKLALQQREMNDLAPSLTGDLTTATDPL